MLARYRKSLGEVRASYTPEKAAEERRSELLAHWVHRPLSFLVTPFFLLSGFSADGVTAFMFVVAAAMPVAAWAAGPWGFATVAALVLAFQVLDCVDGNVARVTRRGTPVGAMLDGLCSLVFWALYFVTIGVLAQGEGSWVARHGREIGLALAALLLAQRECEDTFDDRFGERVRTEPSFGNGRTSTPPEAGTNPGERGDDVPGTMALKGNGAGVPATEIRRSDAGNRFDLRQAAKFAEQSLCVLGPLVAGAFDAMPVFLAGLAFYQISVFALWLPRYVGAIARRRRL